MYIKPKLIYNYKNQHGELIHPSIIPHMVQPKSSSKDILDNIPIEEIERYLREKKLERIKSIES